MLVEVALFLIDGRLNLFWSSGHHGYIQIDYLQTRRNLQQNADLSTPKTAVSVYSYHIHVDTRVFIAVRLTFQ